MKRVVFILFFFFPSVFCFAGHIAGGEIYYKYLGAGTGANTSRYQITLRLFRECNPPSNGNVGVATLPATLQIAIYNNTSPSTLFGNHVTVSIKGGGIQTIAMGTINPCFVGVNAPPCYQIGLYEFTQDLPNTAAGYTVMYQTCCRTTGILNMQGTYSAPGALSPTDGSTYTCDIPGTNALPAGINSSPEFAIKDTTLVCRNSPFKLDFSATDADAGDSLSYAFCAAFDRGNTQASADINYSSPPFNTLTYTGGFNGTEPLGPGVTIDPRSGIISGIAPSIGGRYVVNVCIKEWRNGKIISEHRKDFTLVVSDCSLTAATLKPSYITCNGTTLNFENQSTSSNITSYLWDFGVSSLTTDVSTDPTPSFDYLKSGKDSGTFTVKLKVTSVNGCQDSTTSLVKVYPGFVPGFMVTGTCFLNRYSFTDTSKTRYGTLQTWRWDFGDSTTTWADTSHAKDSVWKYPVAQNAQVRLIVSNSVGCIDTVTRTLAVLDKPVLNLPFRDTLICSIDTLMLRVNINSGSVLWRAANGPNQARILNTTTSTPLVFPRDTTKYYVSVNDNGCANTDSVIVNVLNFINVNVGLDRTICLTDTFRMSTVSDALNYQWTSSSGEQVQNVKYPIVRPLVNTQYNVTANLGKCQAKDSMLAIVSPYPNVTAGPDLTICYGTRVQLNGSANGSFFSWSPAASLINQNTLTPTAGPTQTTTYILSTTNATGCLKPKTDTVIVTVIPPIMANAGRDTAAVPGQSLQLNATGGLSYVWSSNSFLNDPTIANPVARFDNSVDSIIYTVRVSNGSCYSDDQVKVRIFKTGPDILVPSGFTPNADGKNDVLKAVTIGIAKLSYFSVYNRWGQLLFSTTEENKGWDGNFSGLAQPAGTYVYQAIGLDYIGNTIQRKGTVVLIR
jgi:gliding motility-associated-like protein